MSNTNFFRSTKIVATIGTATDDYENIKSLIKAGVNVFRLNFSHGNHGDHLKRITYIRGAEKELNINVAILADLQGPKFRIGEMKKDIKVIKGNNFTFDKDTKIGDFNSVYLSHEEIFESLSVGSKILMDDGKLQFEVKKITNEKIPPEKVPGIQKEIILECRQAGKPVIVATQMLESMIESPAPTRAEASDVATAVFDGADAVMLSAETAIGSFPIETVNIMDRIISSAERHIHKHPGDGPQGLVAESFVYNAVSSSAVSLAESVKAKAVVAFTASGNTAYRMARERPNLLLVVMTPEVNVKRKLSLLWGAYPFLSKVQGYEAAIQEAREIITKEKLAAKGDSIVVVAGMPFGISGSTNSIRVVEI